MARGRTFEGGQRARELFDQGLSCNAIARELAVSPSTISGWAAREHLSFDRSATAAAVAAHSIDAKARRQNIAARLMDRAEEFIEQMDQPFLAFNFGGKDNTYEEHELTRPPTGDIRNLMQSTTMALKEARELERMDGDQQIADGESLVRSLAEALGLAPRG